jgi:hypothetical protein
VAAATDCCKLGMRLIDFPDDAAYAEFWATSFGFSTLQWIYMAPTFNDGDGTDRWCRTLETVPKIVIKNIFNAYENCAYDLPSSARLLIDGGRNSWIIPNDYNSTSDYVCLV